MADGAGQLAERLAHEAGLKPHVAVADLAFDFGPGHQRRHRVDHDHVDTVGAHEGFRNVERLLAKVRLADEQFVQVHPERAGVLRVEGMFRVDEGGDATGGLGIRHHLQREGRLAAGFRPVDFHDAAARDAPDAKGPIERDRSGRGDSHRRHLRLAVLHDHALPMVAADLCQGEIKGLPAGLGGGGQGGAFGVGGGLCGHESEAPVGDSVEGKMRCDGQRVKENKKRNFPIFPRSPPPRGPAGGGAFPAVRSASTPRRRPPPCRRGGCRATR